MSPRGKRGARAGPTRARCPVLRLAPFCILPPEETYSGRRLWVVRERKSKSNYLK